jgi:hypothetical protein
MNNRITFTALMLFAFVLPAPGAKWGFIDKTGKTVIPARYDDVGWFHGGRAIVQSGDSTLIIDRSGRVIAHPAYDRPAGKGRPASHTPFMFVFPFHDGRARVYTGKLYGYIDTLGRVVISPRYLFAGDFGEGLAPVSGGEHWGYIDVTGKTIIEPQFTYAGAFAEGFARADTGGEDVSGVISKHDGALAGYIDRTGAFVLPPQWQDGRPFAEGRAIVRDTNAGLYGAINRKGEYTVAPFCSYIGDFCQGWARAEPEEDIWAFVDTTGNRTIKGGFGDARDFSDDLAAVYLDGKWGFVDRWTGTAAIKFQFDDVCPFAESLAAVKLDGKWGFIKRDGSFVLQPRYTLPVRRNLSFSEGLCAVPLEE